MGTSFLLSICCVVIFYHSGSLAQQAPSSGLYFTLGGTVYLPGDTVLITDIGDFISSTDPGASLVCVTSNVNTQCCRGSDGGNVGEWFFPDGSIVLRNSHSLDFSRSGYTHQVRLNRRNNAMGPIGPYECRVPDDSGGLQTANIVLTTDSKIYLNGDNLFNHELIVSSNFPLGSAMQCLAIGECCSLNPFLSTDAQLGISPSGIGSWRYPNGSYVRLALAGDFYGISRQPGRVNLHYQIPSTAEGVWRCDVPGVGGAIDTSYVGIYAPGNGDMSISRDVYLRMVNLDPLKFALVCVTTGGPATHVTWMRNGIQAGIGAKVITDYEEATYTNEIVMSGSSISGRYDFQSSNAVTDQVTSMLDVSGVRLLLHNGSTVSNNSIVGYEHLPAGTALLCSTDKDNVDSSASWISPVGHNTTTIFIVSSGTSVLQMERTTSPIQLQHGGMWHCEIPDRYNTIQYIYVGLYSQGQGVISVHQEAVFSLISESPLVFTLTCITTGGPATTVEWRRDGGSISNGGSYSMMQIIVDTQRSTYEHQLTVSGRHLGMYNVSVSNSRTPSPVQSQYTVTEAAPPQAFNLSLFSDDGVSVTWTPAPSADITVVYIIYYSSGVVSGEVSVPALAPHHTLRVLTFGATYDISMAARADFETRIGPKRILIGIPDVAESVRAVAGVTSIQLDWSPPSEYHGAITHYQVWYHCADNTAMSDISTDTLWTLTGLRPETTCVMKVRAHTGAGAGDYSNTVTATTALTPVVAGVLVEEVLDASSIRLTWEPVVLQHWEVDHYTIYYTTFSTTTTKTIHQETVPTPSTKNSEVFYLTHLDPKFEHWFQVTVSIEVDGEEFESLRLDPLTFNFDASHFQLHLSPVDNCASWDASRATALEHSIHVALTEAISELCNCSFSAKFLRMGKFRCWKSPSEVTYRSTIVGVASHNSSQLVGYVENWVRSDEAVVDVGQLSLQVLSSNVCSVGLSSLSEGECERSRMEEGTPTLSLVSQDPGTIKCVQSCLVQK